uniref:RNA-directed DNA polymerase, eukaryota n=1 Tax=Tanacetum cinerariifolium TaxID=118510 RepID=A0A699GIX5_TANCI|nr:RNA-directed DNA polymerase, eukaryota [Tanacetum cinerariifolium]
MKLSSPLAMSFRREPRGGAEQQQMTELLSFIDYTIISSTKDRWYCDLTSDGIFRVKEFRNLIDDKFLPSHHEATKWVKCVPIKVNVFMWRARRNGLPTRLNLVSRGVATESSSCPICNNHDEDLLHVCFRCELAQSVLNRVCHWWGLDSRNWGSFADWQLWLSSLKMSSKTKDLLEGVFLVAWWSIWNFRNRPKSSASSVDSVLKPLVDPAHKTRTKTWKIKLCLAGASSLAVHSTESLLTSGTTTDKNGTRGRYLATSLAVLPPRVSTKIRLARDVLAVCEEQSHNAKRAKKRETSEPDLVRWLLRSHGRIGVAGSLIVGFLQNLNRRLQGSRFLGLQVKITWATRLLKFSYNEVDRFSKGYEKSFILSQSYRSFELQRVHGVKDEKHVWFKVELHGAQGNREAEGFQVSNDDDAVAQRRLKDKQLEEKTNTDCLVKEHEKGVQGEREDEVFQVSNDDTGSKMVGGQTKPEEKINTDCLVKEQKKECQVYGRVIDAFIPNRRSKAGNKFGFVRFIHIKDIDRLVRNLCTIWVGRFRLHANVARFQRNPLNKKQNDKVYNEVPTIPARVPCNSKGVFASHNSYVGAVKNKEYKQDTEENSIPSLVLDESCFIQYDYSLALKGKVADYILLTNLKRVLIKE